MSSTVIRDKLIVLRKIRFRDADLILHALNPKGSKVSLIAKGALRSRKRFGGGVLEPTHYIGASYKPAHRNRSGELAVLQEAHLLEEFRALKGDYERLETALQFLKWVDLLAHAEDLDAENIFHLLGNSLRAAESSAKLKTLQLQFELKALYYQGILPQMEAAQPFLRAGIDQHQDFEVSRAEFNHLSGQTRRLVEQYTHRPI